MTALFPLYLAAGAAVIAPILLHLRRRMPKQQVEFSSLQFLAPSPMVTATRSKIVRWLLLLLRCLALLLLAAMFARPFSLTQDRVQGQGRAVVLLLDRSASMQHDDHWTQAVGKARQWLGKCSPQDQIAIATFDQRLQIVSSFEENAAKGAAERGAPLNSLACGWARSNLGQALVDGVTLVTEAAQAVERRLVVISDFQEGSDIEALRGFAWPESVQMVADPIVSSQTSNLAFSLVAAAAAGDDEEPKQPLSMLRVRLANARDSKSEHYRLRWKSGDLAAEGQLLPGTTRVVKIPRPESAAPQILELAGDEWAFDNQLFLAPPQPRLVKVGVLAGGEDASSVESPLYYLNRALVPTSKLEPVVTQLSSSSVSEGLGGLGWLVATNDAEASAAPAIGEWLEKGGRMLCVVTQSRADFLKNLLGAEVSLKEADVKDYALMGELDFAHPVLKPFQDVRLRDFTRIHFWRYRQTQAAESLKLEVIARFDNGDPAWLSLTRGKGRLVLMLSGWHPRDSQLALSSKFVPLLFGLLAEAGISLEQPAQFSVGEPLPEGAADKPGFVMLKDGRTLAVNLPPEESRINAMDLNQLLSLGVRMKAEDDPALSPQEQERIANEELEARQQYWLIVLSILLWVLGVETWLAGRKPVPVSLSAS